MKEGQGIVATREELLALKYQKVTPWGRGSKQHCLGTHRSKEKGRGLIFSDVRAYQPYDDSRYIDWRLTAKTGKPYVKLFETTKELSVFFHVSFMPSMYFGTVSQFKSVASARLIALIAWQAVKQGDSVGGYFYTGSNDTLMRPIGRDKGALDICKQLLHFQLPMEHKRNPPFSLVDSIKKISKNLKNNQILVMLHDGEGLTADSLSACRPWLQAYQGIFLHVIDWMECHPLPFGVYPLSDGQTTQLLSIQSIKDNETYLAYQLSRQDNLKKWVRSSGLTYVPIYTFQPISQQYRSFLKGWHDG
jgi:hypothetical protein